jgi:hypothetical protein
MNHSLTTASRTTHLKIAAVSLIAAIVVVVVGINARISDASATARLRSDGPVVVKAGKPATLTSRDGSTIR